MGEEITIVVMERLMAVAREGFTILFNFSFFRHMCSMNQKPKTKTNTTLLSFNEEGIVFQMCTCSFIHSFIRHVQRTTYNEDPTPIHIKKVRLMNRGRKESKVKS